MRVEIGEIFNTEVSFSTITPNIKQFALGVAKYRKKTEMLFKRRFLYRKMEYL